MLPLLPYDSVRGLTVLFGGRSFGSLGDTWEWDGTTWIQRTEFPSPPDRDNPTLAYDSTRKVTVLFGGYRDGQGYLDDTWEWDGTTWINTTPPNSPGSRDSHALAFDSVHGLTVLFGGYDGVTRLGDTWEYSR